MDKLAGFIAFARTAEARSFTGAARELGMSPSGVSKAISRLEDAFGVRLLHRTSRSVTLTPEGAQFYERCRRIAADIEDAEQLLSQARAAPRGRLRVSLPLSLGRQYLARVLPAFAEQYADVQVEARCSDSMVDLIEDGFDVAVRLGTPRDSRLVARKVMTGRLITCAAPAYLERHGVPRRPEQLTGHNCARFLVPSTGVVREWAFQRGGKRFTVPVSGNLTFDHAEALVEAAVAGTAIIQTSSYVAGEALRHGVLRKILGRFEVETVPVWVVYPQNRHLTPRVRVFVAFLVQRLRADAASPRRVASPG